jgi:phosphatidylglycerol:prolipoprotein diacylglycerol transferase
MSFAFPEISPVAVTIPLLGLPIRWYALAYLAGVLGGWRYLMVLSRRPACRMARPVLEDFLLVGTLSILIGGRLGYVLFYQWPYFSDHFWSIFKVWQGGMSFHGGLIGMIVGGWWFSRRRALPYLHFTDHLAVVAPIGIFLGRLANFVNGELYGRITDVSWAVRFPTGDYLPRHPSQLYEAALEGIFLFILLGIMALFPKVVERHGLLSGTFLAVYGMGRFGVEYFREPDPQLGFVLGTLSMGQLLCVPLIFFGFLLIARALFRPKSF